MRPAQNHPFKQVVVHAPTVPAVGGSRNATFANHQQIMPPKQLQEAIPAYHYAGSSKLSPQKVKQFAGAQSRLNRSLLMHQLQYQRLVNLLTLTRNPLLVVVLPRHLGRCAQCLHA